MRACVVYPGAMATKLGRPFRRGATRGPGAKHSAQALPSGVASFIAWIATQELGP
jgi:hypothetical protein